MSYDGIHSVVGKRSVYVPNCKSFLVTEAERKHVRRRARFQQHRNASCHQVFFFLLQGKAPKEIHATLRETLGEHASLYATIRNWVAQFKRGDFSTCDAPHPRWPKTVTTLEIIYQIHELILEDHQISAKSVAEQLGISWAGRVHHSWRFGHAEALRELGPEMPEHGSKTSTVPVVWATFGIFSARSKWFLVVIGDHGRKLVISLWPGDKATLNGVAA